MLDTNNDMISGEIHLSPLRQALHFICRCMACALVHDTFQESFRTKFEQCHECVRHIAAEQQDAKKVFSHGARANESKPQEAIFSQTEAFSTIFECNRNCTQRQCFLVRGTKSALMSSRTVCIFAGCTQMHRQVACYKAQLLCVPLGIVDQKTAASMNGQVSLVTEDGPSRCVHKRPSKLSVCNAVLLAWQQWPKWTLLLLSRSDTQMQGHSNKHVLARASIGNTSMTCRR